MQKDKPKPKIAILVADKEPHDPSNDEALKKFEDAAIKCGLDPIFILSHDLKALPRYDALFVRTIISDNHYSKLFIEEANVIGLICLDNAFTMLLGGNKYEYFKKINSNIGLKTPNTHILSKEYILNKDFHDLYFDTRHRFPIILKEENGFFCEGVHKMSNFIELNNYLRSCHNNILLQEYIPTDYDWRICILNNKPLFACKYHMVKDHWQISKKEGNKRIWGDVECVNLKNVPSEVMDLAINSITIIPSKIGLFGVDIKNYKGQYYLIEVNDNPNIDADFEDQLLGNEVYLKIMGWYANEIKNKAN